MKLIFETMAGLEATAADEIDSLAGILPATVAPGRIVASAPAGVLLPEVVAPALRCSERLGILLANTRVAGLDEIETVGRELPLGEHLRCEQTFAVRGRREGRHDFNHQAVARAAGTGIVDQFLARSGRRPGVDLEVPDVILRAELFDEQLLVWLDLTGDRGLSYRDYRYYAHMASMRPVAAHLLLRLGGWSELARQENVLLVDPFCGSATIPIEAAGLRPDAGGARVHGIERFSRHLQGAAENVSRAGVADVVTLHAGLAERTDEVLPPRAAGEFRMVVTNPPFGRRVARPKLVDRLYEDASRAWQRAGVSRVVTLTERRRSMSAALESAGFEIVTRLAAVYGRFPVTVFVAESAG
jgi:23S rRNA G2445 N2-methylase RlmL